MTDTETKYRKLTQDELVAEARERFGDDPMKWAFECPNCADVATAGDFPKGSAQLGQYCVGNFVEGRGCDWKAFGLLRGPWEVVMADGHSVWGFALAPALPRGDCGGCGRTNVLASDTCPAFPAELGGPHTGWKPA